MENNNINFMCLMCEYRFTSSYVYMMKAIENKNVALVKHLLDYHLDFKVSDCPRLIQILFKNKFNEFSDNQETVVKILSLLADKKAKLKVKHNPGLPLLKLTIENRLWMIFEFFLGYDANWISKEVDGKPIVIFMIESEVRKFKKYTKAHGKIDILVKHSSNFIKWMLEKGLDVDCMDENGDTALILATKYNLLHALPLLLKETKVTTIRNNSGLTAFQVFVQSVGRLDKTSSELIRESCSNTSYNFPDSFYDTNFVNNVYEMFLDTGFSVNDVDKDGLTPLHYAIKQNRLVLAKKMLKNFKNIFAQDKSGNTILHVVVSYCKVQFFEWSAKPYQEMASILIEKGANVYLTNQYGQSPILEALTDKNFNLLEKFKEHGVQLCATYKGSNLLHLFCKLMTEQVQLHQNFKTIIDFLVDEGCDINARDAQSMTPLHYAIRGNNIKMVKKLIDCGANVNSRDRWSGLTPLHEAIYSNTDVLFTLLIEGGADVNAKTNKGQTPLHLVSSTLHGAIEIMIRKGAHVDVPDHSGRLPLHTAIQCRDQQKIKDLLRFGADISDNARVLDSSDYEAVEKIINEHFIKMEVLGLRIDNEAQECLDIIWVYENLKNSYISEVQGLKKQTIGNGISVYDFLHSSRKNCCRLVKNEDINALVNMPGLENWFPNYHGFITSKYYMAIERPKMIEPAMSGWYELTNIRLPELCMYEILSYLSNASLRALMEGNNFVRNS